MTADSPLKSRIVGSGEENPEQLLANPNNVRVHPFYQQEVMTEILEKVGWVQQVIVNLTTSTVLDGHMRVMLAMRRGEKSVPVLYVNLSYEEELLVLASFDRVGRLAVHDGEILDQLIFDITNSFDDIGTSLGQMLTDMQSTTDDERLYVKPPGLDIDRTVKISDNIEKIRAGTPPENRSDLPDSVAQDTHSGHVIHYKVNNRLFYRWKALWQALSGNEEERLSLLLDLAQRQLISDVELAGYTSQQSLQLSPTNRLRSVQANERP